MKPIKIAKKLLLSAWPLLFLLLCRCGVKSEPLPPLTPPFIGVGRPAEMRRFKSVAKKTAKNSKRKDRNDQK